jgi:hypothetical protein
MVNMSMKLFRALLTVWMILWLPVSGAVAAVMPFSTAGSMTTPANGAEMQGVAGDAMAMPCHTATSEPDAPMPGKPGKCTHCELCHLASALLLPALPHIESAIVHTPEFPAQVPAFASHIPELPQRPPRLLHAR